MSSSQSGGTYHDQLLTRSETAASIGVTPATWSGYVSRGFAPAPTQVVGRTPLWDAHEVQRWHQSRPGGGRPPTGTPAFSSTLPQWSGPTRRLMLTPEEAAALRHLLDEHPRSDDPRARLLAGIRDRLQSPTAEVPGAATGRG